MVNFNKMEQLIDEKGIKKVFLCESIGKQKYYYKDLKSGRLNISDENLAVWANILGTTVDYLTDKTDIKNPPEAKSPEDVAKVALFGGDGEVTDEMWQEVKEYVEFIKQRKKKG